MNKEVLKFIDIAADKRTFHYFKYPIWIYDVDTDEILIYNKVSFDKKD